MAKKHNALAKPALEPNEALFQAVSLCRKAGAQTLRRLFRGKPHSI